MKIPKSRQIQQVPFAYHYRELDDDERMQLYYSCTYRLEKDDSTKSLEHISLVSQQHWVILVVLAVVVYKSQTHSVL